MSAIRVALWIVGTLSGAYAMAALWLLPWLDFGVSVAISASCVIGLGLVRAIETDRQRARDKARHPSVWARMDMPQNGVRLRIAHDRVTESIIRDGEVVAEGERLWRRQIEEAGYHDGYPIQMVDGYPYYRLQAEVDPTPTTPTTGFKPRLVGDDEVRP